MKEVIDSYARDMLKWMNRRFTKEELRNIQWQSLQHKINVSNIKIFCMLIVAFLVSIALSITALVVALSK